jgi:MFS family permease
MRRLLAIGHARIYLAGQFFSFFGDSALWLAMGVWVKTLTGSTADAGLVFFFFTAPALLAPASGLLVDRLRRRPLLIATNVLAGGAVLLLLAVDGAAQVWVIYLVMALYGLAYSVLGAAQSAFLTVMVPLELLPDANGALRTMQESLRLIGPIAGAGLFVLVGGHVVAIIDAATFAIAVGSLLLVHVDEPLPEPRRHRWREEVTAGVHHIARTPVLRQVVVASACALMVLGFIETITYAIATAGLHRTPSFVGILASVQGVGAVVGGPTAAPLIRRIGERRLVGLAMMVTAASAFVVTSAMLPVVMLGLISFGVSLPWLVVGFTTLVQRVTPAELQGRVYAAADALVTTPQTISIAVGAALIGVAGYRALLVVMAVVIAASGSYLLTRREQPRLRLHEALSSRGGTLAR